tara:strand:+ start:6890 stop:7666 length:777 start_codon:yes stop_codon:yes gene_type:complete
MDEFQFLAAAPLALALLTVLVASVVQTSSGIGFGMVAAPILILIDTRLVPGPILLLSLIVSAMAAFRERHDIDYRGLTVALGGRIPGTILAGLTITLIPATTFGLVFGTLVLLAVILSVLARSIPPTPKVLLPAGFVSGYMGTLTSIGAPPMALAYQHGTPATIRSTMAIYFVIGAGISIATLAWYERFGRDEVVASVIFLPPLFLGFWLSNFVVRRLQRERVRQIILALCAAASMILIIKSWLALNTADNVAAIALQ